MPRFYIDLPLSIGQSFDLPESVARHVQVLRLQQLVKKLFYLMAKVVNLLRKLRPWVKKTLVSMCCLLPM
ncbi:hypothetical protein [Deefgea sp. CFH1-16]|uniref:hypothetical protein n=1 Tax=Deefgea sp. CFH1-16 TaxID=2675457 RepID=UPI001FFCAAF1|nr:hypothetical protein [Deefgea sp. CFH1-16]